jgi:hypothetical protein
MIRRRKLWLALTLIVGLVIGGAAGYLAHEKLKAPKKAKAEATKTAPSSAAAKKTYVQPSPADAEKIRQTMTFLSSNIGPRPEGKAGEKQAVSYLVTEFEKVGYKMGMEQFPLPSGLTSQNVVTSDPGVSSDFTFLVVAHVDTRSGSPGANDDASGCAAVLELARTIKGTRHFPEVRFLVFGAEEENSYGTSRLGSRYYLSTQAAAERAKMLGVVSMDTIGVGPELDFMDWGPRSPSLADALVAYVKGKGLNGTRLQGNKSDHEPFGEAGIPAVWYERMLAGGQNDSAMHTSADTMDHVFVNLVAESVDTIRGYLLSLDEQAWRSMAAAARAPATTPAGNTK